MLSLPPTRRSGISDVTSAPGIHREGPTSSATLKDLESPCQEPAVVPDSRSVKISQLKNTIKSLKQQKKQVEHQLEEEKKANNQKQKAKRELEVQIQRLNTQKGKLNTDLYHRKCSLKYFEDESKDLAVRLQHSLQHIAELERALSAVTATQEKKDSTSSRSKAVIEWQLEWSIREQALLNAHTTHLKEWLKQIQLERDEYAQHIKEERARWHPSLQGPFPLCFGQVLTLKKEKQHETRQVEKLERSMSKLKNQMAEPLPLEPPAVPSEVELQHPRKEVERVAAELQAQVDNSKRMSVLISGQKERLREHDERLREQYARLQQLAEPQSSFEELNNENKSALQLEQQVKELQEKLGEELLEAASQQNQPLQAQLSLMALPGEGEAAGAAGDDVAACGDYNEGHGKFPATALNPADEPGPGAPAPQELAGADKHGDLCEVGLTDRVEHPGLGSNSCMLFFCWAWLLRKRR
ncbi:GOLGA8N isoform 2 [Pongo abelii]|uniref:GOLGA8N isoform 2 n=2 Tax=Pongo abelii TaxID=9601 RepID=A0A2J8VXV4_PONAB|nr:GOLGA8N isoform 2 [Pongo abelii]